MTILALDLATVTGWAVAPPPYAPAPTPVEAAAGAAMPKRWSGSKSFRHCSGELGRLASVFEDWLNELIVVQKPDLIVFEAPFIGNRPNVNTARMLFGICTVTEMVAFRRGIRCLECHNSTIKAHAGNGRAKKRDMIRMARERGWNPVDDNEADALWLVDYAAALRAEKGRAA